ncbi:MAG TPA: hypothetical protein VNQ90_00185 [Chthoniobacteraceae bacterium]|nr:hypothetical protein [Chthoniobacteraceae bacterium]
MATTPPSTHRCLEQQRLFREVRREENWKRWGTYLSERQWGTVREDYSDNGDAWRSFSHDEARSRAYRWGEDGLLGWTDRECRLCFSTALWNGNDPILKERLFGLSNPEGNHGEDVKECYYYLDATPTHSYARAVYKYPQRAYPYNDLVATNARRSREEPEYEVEDTGVFAGNRYFDFQVEYAKAAPEDLLIRLTATNRGPEKAQLHLLPMLWFRNTWVWGKTYASHEQKPRLGYNAALEGIEAVHPTLGRFLLLAEGGGEWLFAENETNHERLSGNPNATPYPKDAFHRYVISGEKEAVNPERVGTRVALCRELELGAGESITLRLRLVRLKDEGEEPADASSLMAAGAKQWFTGFDDVIATRVEEMNAFYDRKLPACSPEQGEIVRKAYAGLIWSKQFYYYVVEEWLNGDPNLPPPPPGHRHTRNSDWRNLFNRDVISMPDKWEYPWYAAWDLAFHLVPYARIDGDFAQRQLQLFLREWYMHPNGQIPAYEWDFSDTNPPVHAWACWRVYKIAGRDNGRDRGFLERCFQKLLLNFTWWINRKDIAGKEIFSGGFLGLDNIGLFDRSRPLPGNQPLEQADGTAWVAFYCGTMLSIALELACENRAYEDIASKFFEHFIAIVDAMNEIGGQGLWDEEDGFFYDRIAIDGRTLPIKVRSVVGLIPLIAVEVVDEPLMGRFPGFAKRAAWFLRHRPDLAAHISYLSKTHTAPTQGEEGQEGAASGHRRMLAVISRERLLRVLAYMLDEDEFLSPYGIRSLSRRYEAEPYQLQVDGTCYSIGYEPGESRTDMFGGNSNWRGPIWFPLNYLFIEALERYHHFYGDSLKVECPTGSGQWMTLGEVARELARRLTLLFERNGQGRRPLYGDGPLAEAYAGDPHWKDLILFHEYYHAETGEGLGASHQTGWTALVARCYGIAHGIGE